MRNPLFDICCERNSDPVEQRDRIVKILQTGVDINATDKNGVTALHHAVRFRSPIAVKTLIEHGANVNQACSKSGSTPLHRAFTQTGAPGTAGKAEQAKEIIRILLAAGASPFIRNKSGKRPAAYIKHPAVKSVLRTSRTVRK
ncbi:MAG TPA: ankyrin repeat domain-containing protein [Verrucomicrobiae bacterium]|nr:ankyrin repeat domain-containing protein [Verrucomicrobiae bacterium]